MISLFHFPLMVVIDNPPIVTFNMKSKRGEPLFVPVTIISIRRPDKQTSDKATTYRISQGYRLSQGRIKTFSQF